MVQLVREAMFDKTPELYDLFYEGKDYGAEAEKVRDAARRSQPGATTLLDVACGTGAHLAYLKDAFRVEGLDLDAGLLDVARRRLPGVPLHNGDMRTFDLGRTFDVVTCLFSSIGYVETSEGLHQAVGAMARHVAPNGVLLIEPWLSPARFDPSVLGRATLVERPGLKAVRMNASGVENGRSILVFHYLVARPQSIKHLTETHALGLFTEEEHRRAFEAAGLTSEYEPEGLTGRGLWIARRFA